MMARNAKASKVAIDDSEYLAEVAKNDVDNV